MRSFLKSLAVVPALFSAFARAVHPVEIRGQDFVDTVTNKRMMIIGVDYQPGGEAGFKPMEGKDTLTEAEICRRDAAVLQSLGVNTIRVYNTSPDFNHDDCMSIFNAVGIYVIIDVNSPNLSLNRADPESSWTREYLERTFRIVENYKGYPNTLGFFSANEVINDMSTGEKNPPYIRALIRALRNYVANNVDRPIPVGYSAADVRELLQDTWAYLQCDHEEDMSSAEFFGLNSYSWCGSDATFETASYDVLVDMFNESSIPVFFSEYGCNDVKPRVFEEVGALYGERMTALSGGLVYEYSQEEADFGLVSINSDGSVELFEDFDNLQEQYNKLDMDLLQSTDPSGTDITPPRCSEDLITASQFSSDFDLPDAPDGVQDLIDNGVDDPTQGQLVDVEKTEVDQRIIGSNGEEIQDMAIEIQSNDESNTPGGETTSGDPSSTDSSQGPQETGDDEDAAARVAGMGWSVVGVAAVVGAVVMV